MKDFIHNFGRACLEIPPHPTYNKLAKARKTCKWPGTLGLKKFGPGKLQVKKVWAQNISIDFLAELENLKNLVVVFFFNFFNSILSRILFMFSDSHHSNLAGV